MKPLELGTIENYTYGTNFDRYRYESCKLLNEFVNIHEDFKEVGIAVSDILTLPEGKFYALLVDNEQDPLLEFVQMLAMTPDDVLFWLNNLVDSKPKDVVELDQDEDPSALDEPDETQEVDTTLRETPTQTDSDEELYDPDYPNDDLMDNDEP